MLKQGSMLLRLRGSKDCVRVELSTPASGYGEMETPGSELEMGLYSKAEYQELVDALVEVGAAAGWTEEPK